ncbi:LysE family translocator [Streptosporangium sp. NPDC006930]|uniref:LysE family translocator n=1 Tax=unclassified Streptosporangium TaxID=2632669 RepID=UPI0034343315
MSPGPDFAVVVRRSAVSGRAYGMAAAAGVSAGVFVWVLTTASGIAALLATSAVAFTVVKVVGAGYLLHLGVKAWRAALRKGGDLRLDLPDPGKRGPLAAFTEGLLTNMLNPKMALFLIALVPQFVSGDAGLGDALVLSLIAVTGTVLWFFLVVNIVGSLRRLFAKSAVRKTVDGLTGSALIALGIKLAVAGRS